MNNILLTRIQAFAVMQYFFRQYYKITASDDFGSMLGGLMLLEDNKAADEAFAEDWIDSAKVVVPNYHDDMTLTIQQTYAIVKEFLELYCRIGLSEEVQQLINRMTLDQSGNITDQEINDIWGKAVKLAIDKGPMYLQLK